MIKAWGGFGRSGEPDLAVAVGERLLASAAGGDLVVGGTRDALYIGSHRIAWEQVEAAEWDGDESLLTVREVGSGGRASPEHVLALADSGRLVQLVRERVTASILWQRHVPVLGRKGLRVIARRAPGRHGPVLWVFEYDEGLDPEDPIVATVAEQTLLDARADLGLE